MENCHSKHVTATFASQLLADDPSVSEVGLTFAAISWTGKTVLELIMGAVGFFVVTFFKMKKIPQ
jgi:hypothetical protein